MPRAAVNGEGGLKAFPGFGKTRWYWWRKAATRQEEADCSKSCNFSGVFSSSISCHLNSAGSFGEEAVGGGVTDDSRWESFSGWSCYWWIVGPLQFKTKVDADRNAPASNTSVATSFACPDSGYGEFEPGQQASGSDCFAQTLRPSPPGGRWGV